MILNKLLSVTLKRSETDLITSELAMNQTCQNLAMDRNWWSSKAVFLRNASCARCYFSAQFFQSVPLVIRRGQRKKQTVHWYMSEGSRAAILFCELAVTDVLAVDLDLFRFFIFPGNVLVGRTDETFSIYRRTERRATTSLNFVHSDIGADTQCIENNWCPRARTSKELFESNLLAGVLRAAFRKDRPNIGTSSKFDSAHFWLIDNP